MLRKVGIAVAALLIGSMVFAQSNADKGAKAKKAGSVNATWEWKGNPSGKIGTSDTKFTPDKPYDIPAVKGSKGAKFTIVEGTAKFKTESYTALYHGTKDDVTYENIEKNKKAEYAITIDDAATIELLVAGNGSAEPQRMVVVKSGDEQVLSIDNLDGDAAPVPIKLANAPAGKYRVLLNGARIVKVSAKN